MSIKNFLHYFSTSLTVTFVGILLGFGLGWYYEGTWAGALSTTFIVTVLGILEISLSFDNAVVNATVLKDMSPKWQHRFLTWGIAIAVFGMRFIFPLMIVGVVAKLTPWDALILAATQPNEYARIMLSVHVSVASFGGTFLLLVAMRYFFDHQKTIHWIPLLESPASRLGKIEAFEVVGALIVLLITCKFLPDPKSMDFLVSGLWGVITFICVDSIESFLKLPESESLASESLASTSENDKKNSRNIEKISIGFFIYLEVLDASFSFDGVVGAFAITNNLFIIALGLGIGAMYVRSLTIMLVEKGTLAQFRFLEHGAFYAVGVLAVLMYAGCFVEVPEVLTGLLGLLFIGLSLASSVFYNKRSLGA